MKTKLYLATLIAFLGLSVNAQSFGSAGVKVEGTFSTTKPVYYDWLRMGDTRQVTMKFPQTAKGVEDALQIAEQMLVKNRLSIDSPDQYNRVETTSVKKDTPAVLHTAIQAKKRKVNLVWYAADGSALHLFLGPYSYEINVYNAYKLM